MLFFIALFSILTFFYVWLPVKEYKQYKAYKEFKTNYKNFKLISVRRFYPCLQELSFEEIEERYDLDDIFHRIGRGINRH